MERSRERQTINQGRRHFRQTIRECVEPTAGSESREFDAQTVRQALGDEGICRVRRRARERRQHGQNHHDRQRKDTDSDDDLDEGERAR